MYKPNKRHLQPLLISNVSDLPEKKRKRLANSWADDFYRHFFSRIHEDAFAVLYVDYPSRPNVPINWLVGLETLKAGFGWSDEELYDHFCFDLQVRYALGIHDQADFSQVPELSFQPLSSNGFIPFPHSNSGIIQQPAQSSRGAQQPGRARNLPGNTAKAHRSALIDAYDQPDKITDLSDALSRSQFHNSTKPGIIEVVGWHWVSPLLEWLFTTKSSAESIPTNYSFTKVSGG